MSDRNLSDLCPELQALVPILLTKSYQQDIMVKIIVTWRSATDQNDAKIKGLSNASAGNSPHNYVNVQGNPCSLAFDFGVFEGGNYITDGKDPRYAQVGEIAKSLGLTWGGDWMHPDYDHIELQNWRQYGMHGSVSV